MCDRCANIDYPINDPIWLPCGGSPDRYTSRHRVGRLPPLTPNRHLQDQAYDQQTKINDLMAMIRQQRREISTLKAVARHTDSRDSFEGVE